MAWKLFGVTHYLDRQCDRLGLARYIADRAAHSTEIYRVGVLLRQLSEIYHEHDGIVTPAEKSRAEGVIGQCELELQKLHCLAAASQQMIDEAHDAFGLPWPDRPFWVACRFDNE